MFKSGDKVIRIDIDNGLCKKGNIYTIKTANKEEVTFQEITGWYYSDKFKLASNIQSLTNIDTTINQNSCAHKFISYLGLNESYEYCQLCEKKKLAA